MPASGAIAAELVALMGENHDASAVDQAGFEAFSARESTRALAEALDRACDRGRRS